MLETFEMDECSQEVHTESKLCVEFRPRVQRRQNGINPLAVWMP